MKEIAEARGEKNNICDISFAAKNIKNFCKLLAINPSIAYPQKKEDKNVGIYVIKTKNNHKNNLNLSSFK